MVYKTNKTWLIVLFICTSIALYSQRSKSNKNEDKYTNNEEFSDTYTEMLEGMSKNSKASPKVEEQFEDIWDNLDPTGKNIFVNIANSLARNKLENLKTLRQVFSTFLYVLENHTGNSNKFFALYNKNVKFGGAKKIRKDIKMHYQIFFDRNFSSSKSYKWTARSEEGGLKDGYLAPMTMRFSGEDTLIYELNNVNLYCASKNLKRSFALEKADFVFNFNKKGILLKKGKLYWNEKLFKRGQMFAEVFNVKINPNSKGFDSDSTILNNNYKLFKGKFDGELSMSLERKVTKKSKYPKFSVTKQEKKFENIFPNISIAGKLRVYGRNFKLYSGKKLTNELEVKRDGILMGTIKGKSFSINDDGIEGDRSEFSVFLENEFFAHSSVKFSFSQKKRKIELLPTSDVMSKAPFVNTYHKIDMPINYLIWHIDEDKIYFQTDPLDNKPITSSNFYDQGIYDSYKGLSKVSTLDLLRKMYEGDQFTDYNTDDIAGYLELPKDQTQMILMQLAEGGFVSFNIETNEVRLNLKLINYWNAKYNEGDYDRIIFYGKDSVSTFGYININTKVLELKGVDMIMINENTSTFAMPYKEKVVVNANLDFKFDGAVYSGILRFEGFNNNFIYDHYSIHMDSIKKIGFTFLSEESTNQTPISVPSRNHLVNTKGTLTIDSANNKSSKKRFYQFPKFETSINSYLTLNLKKDSKTFHSDSMHTYVVVYPFEIDSLYKISASNFSLPGETFSVTEIIPEIEVKVKANEDGTLGFEKKLPPEGISIYAGKAKYFNDLRYNEDGLGGSAEMKYNTTEAVAKKFHFYYKGVEGQAHDFKIKPNSIYPFVTGTDISVNLEVDSNYLEATPKRDNPLLMYGGELKNPYPIYVHNEKVTGSGYVKYLNSSLYSKDYLFKNSSIASDVMNATLKDASDEDVVKVVNTSGDISVQNKTANFNLGSDSSYANFIPNLYKVKTQEINWDIKKGTLAMSNVKQDSAQKPNYMSTVKSKDSLEYVSYKGSYSLSIKKIKSEEVEPLKISDAIIEIPDKKLTVNEAGEMSKIKDAIIKINYTDSTGHILKKGEINIKGKNNYTGKAQYSYLNYKDEEYLLDIQEIKVDEVSKYTVAKGEIKSEDEFKLNDQFKFYGSMELYGIDDFPRFVGNVSIAGLKCPGIEIPGLPIDAFIDPKDVQIEPTSDKIYNGFYNNRGEYIPTFLSNDTTLFSNSLSNEKGSISYNGGGQYFEISIPEDSVFVKRYVRLHRNTCDFETKSKIELGRYTTKIMESKAYGSIKKNLRTDKTEIKTSLLLDFPFDPKIANLMYNDLQNAIALEIEVEDDDRLLMTLDGETTSSEKNKYYDYITNFEATRIVPPGIAKLFLFSQIDLVYDENSKMYLNNKSKKLALHLFNKKYLAKVFKGYMSVKPGNTRDEIQFYIEIENGNYYYFSIQEGFVTFLTSNLDIVAHLSALTPEQRKFDIPGTEDKFIYRAASIQELERFKGLFPEKKAGYRNK